MKEHYSFFQLADQLAQTRVVQEKRAEMARLEIEYRATTAQILKMVNDYLPVLDHGINSWMIEESRFKSLWTFAGLASEGQTHQLTVTRGEIVPKPRHTTLEPEENNAFCQTFILEWSGDQLQAVSFDKKVVTIEVNLEYGQSLESHQVRLAHFAELQTFLALFRTQYFLDRGFLKDASGYFDFAAFEQWQRELELATAA